MVSYKGKFSQDKQPALIRIVLNQVDGKTYVSGFWIISLKDMGISVNSE